MVDEAWLWQFLASSGRQLGHWISDRTHLHLSYHCRGSNGWDGEQIKKTPSIDFKYATSCCANATFKPSVR